MSCKKFSILGADLNWMFDTILGRSTLMEKK